MTTLSPHIANDLKQIIKGDVLFDEASRNFYSTAACIYKIKPLGVVAPKSIDDVVATVGMHMTMSSPSSPGVLEQDSQDRLLALESSWIALNT